jgi:hypothetical protein
MDAGAHQSEVFVPLLNGAAMRTVYTVACRRRVAGLDLLAAGADGSPTRFSGSDPRQRLHAWRTRLWGACRVREVAVEPSGRTGTSVDARSP